MLILKQISGAVCLLNSYSKFTLSTELSVLKNDELSAIMKSTKQSQDSFCSGKELGNGTNE